MTLGEVGAESVTLVPPSNVPLAGEKLTGDGGPPLLRTVKKPTATSDASNPGAIATAHIVFGDPIGIG